jgi:hypothetical protein
MTVALILSVLTLLITVTDGGLRDTVGVMRTSWRQDKVTQSIHHTTVTPELTP